MGIQKESDYIVHLFGESYLYEDLGGYIRLTSPLEIDGKHIILEFTKNQTQSQKALSSFKAELRKSIINNHR